MPKKLFVGNLPFKMTDNDLNSLFSQEGAVLSAKIIMDHFSERSKGFGFVEMENDQEADQAIEKLNNHEIEGRKIVVNVARPMKNRGDKKKAFKRW